LASIGEGTSRRALLSALAALPVVSAAAAAAAEYASPEQVLDTIDRLETEAAARFLAVARKTPAARALADSLAADRRRHREERASLRRRLGLAVPSLAEPTAPGDAALEGLRAAQEALVYAHAEGLTALGDSRAVAVLARHMVAGARALTVLQLWIEAEEQRG
jgi:hypothetical protein